MTIERFTLSTKDSRIIYKSVNGHDYSIWIGFDNYVQENSNVIGIIEFEDATSCLAVGITLELNSPLFYDKIQAQSR